MLKRYTRWIVATSVSGLILVLGELAGLYDSYSLSRRSFGVDVEKSGSKADPFRQIWTDSENILVDLQKSDIYILGKKTVYRVEDEVKLGIIMYNRNGERRRKGGDAIKVRMFEDSVNASATGHVRDHGDGTYTATLKCLWVGTPFILVYLYYTKEIAELTRESLSAIPTIRYTLAVYQNGVVEKCHPFRRRLNGSRSICNFTELNGGMSWYCEKPAQGDNSCEDIRYFTHGPLKPYLSIQKMFNISRGTLEPTFKNTVKPPDREKRKCKEQRSETNRVCYDRIEPYGIECSRYSRVKLWTLKSPTGFFYRNRWHMLHCSRPDFQNIVYVLRNKHLVLYGDSTVRQWLVDLKERINCELVSEKWTKPNWQFDSKIYCAKINSTIDLVFHSLPGNLDRDKLRFNSISEHLLNFRGWKEVIVLIYLQNHFYAYNDVVFLNRIKHIRDSVGKILEANSKATIFIKGGHTCWSVLDYKNRIYKRIVKDSFKDISDKVIYLDNEEIAVAKQVKDPHPGPEVVRAMVNQMLAYIPS